MPSRRPLASVVLLLALLAAQPAAAQLAEPDTLYDAGRLSFSYVQTPFPGYSGDFEAEGEGLAPDGTLPPGALQAVGGGSAATVLDTVATVAYAVIANADGTFDGALLSLKTIGPLTAGSYPVDIENGTALFGFIDDAEEFALPDTLDNATVIQWLQELPAYHKLISTSGAINVAACNADTLFGTFSGTAVDLDNFFFFVNFSDGRFDLSGAEPTVAAPDIPANRPTVRAWPNPFNPLTSVVFALPRAQQVEAAVFDLAGRRLRTLHQGPLAAGPQRLNWNGLDQAGRRAPAGVYLVQVRGERWQDSVKVVLAP